MSEIPSSAEGCTPLAELLIWEDEVERSGAEQMAVDECLLRAPLAGPVLRIYKWPPHTGSFGYAARWEEVLAGVDSSREWIRRWSGGGVVLHGDDLTYTLVLPFSVGEGRLPGAWRQSVPVYHTVHGALAQVLRERGVPACLVPSGGSRAEGPCFQQPVTDDVEVAGRKVAGAGQRRAREGILHQGSLRDEAASLEVARALGTRLAQKSAPLPSVFHPASDLLARVVTERYGADAWRVMR